MNLNQKFNSLHGTIVSRKTLEKLLEKADKEKYTHISTRIIRILETYPDDRFLIEIASLVEPYGLNGVEMEMLDIDELNEPENETGLNGIPQADIYDLITKKIIKDFENDHNWESGINDTFDDDSFLTAFNFKTKKPYRGINQLLLGDILGTGKLKNPYYLTFNQVKELKGTVKKGAKSHDAIFYTIIYRYKDFKTTDRQKFIDYLKTTGKFKTEEIPAAVALNGYGIIRIYNVFNGFDIDGIDFKLDQLKPKPSKDDDKIDIADKIIERYPAPAPAIKYGGKQPFYERIRDFVQMPKKTSFNDIRIFYAVMFHELVHSTGSTNRLNREKGAKFGDNKYAFEELVAEIGACFLSATCGFLYYVNKNANSYIKGWRQGIIAELKEDNKGIFKAAALAQKAVDFMLTNITEKDFEASETLSIKKTDSQKKNSVHKKNTIKALPKTIIAKRKQKQLSLFDPGLKSPATKKTKEALQPISTNPKVQKIGASNNHKSEYFKVSGEEGKFLQAVERKPIHSVVITMDGQQGAGKTTTLYKFMNSFAEPGNKCLFISGEEHPSSDLAKDKVKKYLSNSAQQNIDSIGELESQEELYKLISPYEIIFIDSWQKLQRMVGNIRLDEDLRKRFNGKVFVIIFQQTTTGRTKGGAEVVFDGDIIIKMIKEAKFSENYAYFDKNRYTKVPIETIRYNIASGKNYNPEQPQESKSSKFSFSVN
ncbi:zincin-like metallopeptidase domain-containing protein [Flavobacterium sp. GCM10027622]|uniref:zincin-like metallopeptidase domain-containing protein n=1 Tax=unclassified Flavobacterium TaxID=196869 RepID=UPI00361FE4F8